MGQSRPTEKERERERVCVSEIERAYIFCASVRVCVYERERESE